MSSTKQVIPEKTKNDVSSAGKLIPPTQTVVAGTRSQPSYSVAENQQPSQPSPLFDKKDKASAKNSQTVLTKKSVNNCVGNIKREGMINL